MPTYVEVPISHSPSKNVSIAKQSAAYTLPLHGEELAIVQTLLGDVDAFNQSVPTPYLCQNPRRMLSLSSYLCYDGWQFVLRPSGCRST